jgi:type IV fimbrial biogenesis protein FimT
MDNHGSVYIRAGGTGFTILEMLLVLAITAILMVIGIPALQTYEMRQRMSAAMHLLHSHLALARNDAILFNTEVVACPGTAVAGCTEGADWSAGWIVFADLNGDRRHQPGENLLRAEPGLEQLVIRSTSGRTNLRFYPNGSAPGSNGSITFCDGRGPPGARKLVISNTGRIRRDEAPETDVSNCPSTTG